MTTIESKEEDDGLGGGMIGLIVVLLVVAVALISLIIIRILCYMKLSKTKKHAKFEVETKAVEVDLEVDLDKHFEKVEATAVLEDEGILESMHSARDPKDEPNEADIDISSDRLIDNEPESKNIEVGIHTKETPELEDEPTTVINNETESKNIEAGIPTKETPELEDTQKTLKEE